MNVKYYYEFRGLDEVLNRVEILTSEAVVAKEIKATSNPFVVEYSEVKKLESIQGSGATLNLVSQSIFQFTDLHIDDMQGYIVRFYRDGNLYWLGYLDPELYDEQLSLFPPYPVEFTAADFNVLDRLKYRDENEQAFTGINSLFEHLKRCFKKLALPFNYLYIGCSTTAEGITTAASETIFHKLFVSSSNFYDENNEPMSCRDVVSSILEPFGMMMVQRDASVYLYDYNTVVSGGNMKCYRFSDYVYEGEKVVLFSIGDLKTIGFMSTDSSFGYEEMINNVKITSSLYGDPDLIDESVDEKKLSDLKSEKETDDYIRRIYSKCIMWNAKEYLYAESKDTNDTVIGAKMPYTGEHEARPEPISFANKRDIYVPGGNGVFMRIKCDVYASTNENLFDTEKSNTENAKRITLRYKLCVNDGENDLMYYSGGSWKSFSDPVNRLYPYLYYISSTDWKQSVVTDKWMTNSPATRTGSDREKPETIVSREKDLYTGVRIPPPPISGYITLDILSGVVDENLTGTKYNGVVDFLINNVSISFEDADGNTLSTDDYVFKSYVDKKVRADYRNVTLKCISANEDLLPIGRANLLKKEGGGLRLQVKFTRSGQTDILERLLLCTIHSNYTRKNRVIKVDVNMTDNPAMRYCTYGTVLGDGRLITLGCELDFYNAKTTITACDFSQDVDKLSNIPYE